MGKRNIKKTLLLFALAVALSSCGKNSPKGAQDDMLDRIRRTGVIEACTAIDPPFSNKDAKTGTFSGIYVDAMNLIAEKMNAKVRWHETTFNDATGEIASGRCDIMISDFFATIPRAMSIAFTSPPLAYLGLGVLVRKNDPRFRQIQGPMELDKSDLTLSVSTGEAGDNFVSENFKKAKIKRIDAQASDLSRFCVEVSAGRADAALGSIEYFERYTRKHPEVVDIFASRPFSLNPIAWGVRQNDIKWLHFINTALQFLDTQGTMEQLEKKYHTHLLHLVKQYKLQ